MHSNSNQPHKDREATPIVVFNPAPGPRTEAVQIHAQLPGSLNQAVIVDEQGRRMPLRIVNRWRQELGSMPFAREMIAAAVALMGESAPGDFIHLAQTTLGGMLGQAETAYEITRVTIEEGQQPGVAAIEVMLSRAGNNTIDTQHLYAAESTVLDLLEREDINMLEFTAIDEARQIIDFIAADLPAYGLKTFWIYPHGLEGDTQPALAVSTDAAQDEASSRLSIENEFYTVEANQEDGTLTITDKKTHAVFTGLNHFLDGGDVGDLYNYCPPEHDLIISKPETPPKIELLSSGPVRSILRVSGHGRYRRPAQRRALSATGRDDRLPHRQRDSIDPRGTSYRYSYQCRKFGQRSQATCDIPTPLCDSDCRRRRHVRSSRATNCRATSCRCRGMDRRADQYLPTKALC